MLRFISIRIVGFLAACAASFPASPLGAQAGTQPLRVHDEVFVDGELERYLRVLQTLGEVPLYPWSIRAFGPAEIDRLVPRGDHHPWAFRYDFAPDTTGRLHLAWIRPDAALLFNSGFPYGSNDGAVWAGRGATAALRAGFAARYGRLSLTVAPVAFWTQNAAFDMAPNGEGESFPYADWRYPDRIDLPQRFGDGSYARIDPGQSTLRLDLPYVSLGASTANQHWGPVGEYPLILGDNAAGFPHAFVGTSSPLNIGIGRLHGRLVWGRLDQSLYSPVRGRGSHRFMSGIVAAFTPRALDGLEIGGARFFHTAWPADGLHLSDFTNPVEGVFKAGLLPQRPAPDRVSDVDNQLASVFGRWVLPRSGFEVYGEYGREDHNYGARDLVLEPDHDSGYVLGARKAWVRSDSSLFAVRGEVMNTQISHLNNVRPQLPFYIHSYARQGHTEVGQTLGAPAVYGGAGALLALDRYTRSGRWSVFWSREVRADRQGYTPGQSRLDAKGVDVVHSLGAEAVVFRGRYDLRAGITGAYELNRYFGRDAFNLNLNAGVDVGL